jgi:uncharacterized membrane protein
MPHLETGNQFTKRVGQTLVTGVFAILPLALMIAVLAWITKFLHDLIGPTSACGRMFRSIGMNVTACEFTAYQLGLIGAVLLIYGLGWLVENRIGQRWNTAINGILQRIPLVNTIYDASKNLTSVFDRRDDTLQRMAPVMCCFGGDRSVAIPCLMPTPELVHFDGNEYHVVIIPTAPVPFGGALVCVKKEWVSPARCSLDELIGIYMSMGTSAPGCFEKNNGDAALQYHPT